MQGSQSSRNTRPVPILCTQSHTMHSAEDREAPGGAAFQGAHSSFTLTAMQWLHTGQFLQNPVIFLLAYRIAAWNVDSHRNNSIKAAWEFAQADLCRCSSIHEHCDCAITFPVTTVVKVCYFRARRPQRPSFQTITLLSSY